MTDININKIAQGIAKIIEDGVITEEERATLFSLTKEALPLFKNEEQDSLEAVRTVEEQDGFVRTVNKELVLLGSSARLKGVGLLKDKADGVKHSESFPDGGSALNIGFIVGDPVQSCLPLESFTFFYNEDDVFRTFGHSTTIFEKPGANCWF